MILNFELSMPNKGSWDGKWSGEGRPYTKTVHLGRGKEAKAKGEAILDKGSFHYSWSDGWGARVTVKQVDSHEVAKIRKKSVGFCGYDWMVRSIIAHNEIRNDVN